MIQRVFFRNFFKTFKIKKIKNPIILILTREILLKKLKMLNVNLRINDLSSKKLELNKIKKNHINFINIHLNSKFVNNYIEKCFKHAIKILKANKRLNLINGPINKKKFLNKKFIGITEYLGSKMKKQNKTVMLIYNEKISVSPITTHIPLKDVNKKISKNKIIYHVKSINSFYKSNLKKSPKIAITGLNPHCESNFFSSEEEKL